jgi:hypothetical protein
MQNPNHPCAHLSRVASRVLRFALRGTGTVLDVTGAALACTGLALQICGQKLKSLAAAHPPESSAATDSAEPQPAA